MPDPLHFRSARDLADLVRRRELSAREVVEAHLAQIERVNPRVNAICTLIPEQALADADDADAALAAGRPCGPLHGLPIVIKDLVSTAGIRTTFGSPIYADHVPDQDDLIVERLRAAGAIILGKSNTPEFGAGSHTFNPVFGATCNPYDLTRSCGGSSGGAAVALATGMAPIADGSDLGGSLRNPASFCNVVGFRPSPGRVPSWPALDAWSPLAVLGPMARSVADAALLLSAIAGPDPRAPIGIAEPPDRFASPLDADFRGARVAWSRNLGRYPVEPVVTQTIDAQRPVFEGLGCVVEDGEPDFRDADAIFQTLRAWATSRARIDDLRLHRDRIKDTVIWNTERGLALSGMDVSEAVAKRSELYQRVHEFMQRYRFLVLPAAAVPPFPIEQPWVREIDGVAMETYIDWMAVCYAITLTGLPAISVSAGFTPEGLPVGVQIVGRHQADFEVLQLAHAFEVATGFGRTRPAVAG
ncbi:MAG: amidase [Chloroflexi bacterium]|nr:amidase [Chloroflexota bacterium]